MLRAIVISAGLRALETNYLALPKFILATALYLEGARSISNEAIDLVNLSSTRSTWHIFE